MLAFNVRLVKEILWQKGMLHLQEHELLYFSGKADRDSDRTSVRKSYCVRKKLMI